MMCESKRTILCDDPPNDDTETEEEGENVEAPTFHLEAVQNTLISEVAITPSLPPPPAHVRSSPPPTFMCRSTDRLEVSTLSRVLECLNMLDLVRARPVCRAWRDAIDCAPYFFEPTPFPSQRLWQQKGFEFVSVDPAFKFALCPLATTLDEGSRVLFQSQSVLKLQVHGEWGVLSALFLSFFGKKAVRRKARNELTAQCVVKRRGQLFAVEVTGRAVENSQVSAARGGVLQPRVCPVPTDNDWDRHGVISSDAHIIVFTAEDEPLREAREDPEADFFEEGCELGVEEVLIEAVKIPETASRLRKKIEVEERLNGLESVVEYLPWEIPFAVVSEPTDSRVAPLTASLVESTKFPTGSSLVLECDDNAFSYSSVSTESVLSRNRQHALTAISKALKQCLENDGFSVVARDSPEELPSLEQSLATLVNQVQAISSQGFEIGLECLEFSKDTSVALLQTGSAHTSNVLSTTAAAGSRLLQSSLTYAVSSLQGWWSVEEVKDTSTQGEEEVRVPLGSSQEDAARSSDEIF